MDYQLVCDRVRPKGAVGETTVCYVVGLRADGDPSSGQGFLWKGGGWSAVNVVDGAEVGLRVPEERRVSLEQLNLLQKQALFSELKGYLEPNTARQLFGLPKLKLRLYDRPGAVDRYTAVLEGEPVWLPDGRLYWQGYAFGADLTPRGCFQHVEVAPDADLGRPIALNDLPDDVRANFLQTLASEFPYPEEIDLSEVEA